MVGWEYVERAGRLTSASIRWTSGELNPDLTRASGAKPIYGDSRRCTNPQHQQVPTMFYILGGPYLGHEHFVIATTEIGDRPGAVAAVGGHSRIRNRTEWNRGVTGLSPSAAYSSQRGRPHRQPRQCRRGPSDVSQRGTRSPCRRETSLRSAGTRTQPDSCESPRRAPQTH